MIGEIDKRPFRQLPEHRKIEIRGMSEAALQACVVDMAETAGWRVAYIPDFAYRLMISAIKKNPRRGYRWSKPGNPDLLMVRGGIVIHAELKRHTGQLREPQVEWLTDLAECGGPVEVYLWRPMDWFSGEIESVLTRPL